LVLTYLVDSSAVSQNDLLQDILILSCTLGGVICLIISSFIGFVLIRNYKRKKYIPIENNSLNSQFSSINEPNLEKSYFKIRGKEIKLKERIGKGSFADVFRGEWRGISVAVKKIPFNLLNDKNFLNDFNKESSIMNSLRHPNVLQFLGSCFIEKDMCIVTEFMSRGSVYKLLHSENFDLPFSLMKKWSLETAQGMLYLHQSQPPIFHRDLKSHNLLADENYKLKICDFGLSRVVEQITKTMTSCGTAAWAAPEVLKNSRYTEKADVYSYGVCLWEFWTRRDPYEGMATFQIIFAVGTEGLRPVIPSECPREYAKLIEDCWDSDPRNRPSFLEVIEKLKTIQEEKPELLFEPQERRLYNYVVLSFKSAQSTNVLFTCSLIHLLTCSRFFEARFFGGRPRLVGRFDCGCVNRSRIGCDVAGQLERQAEHVFVGCNRSHTM